MDGYISGTGKVEQLFTDSADADLIWARPVSTLTAFRLYYVRGARTEENKVDPSIWHVISSAVASVQLCRQIERLNYITSLKFHSSQVTSWISRIHSSLGVDIRHCVLESMISKGMHFSLARLGWQLPYGEP